MSKLLMGLLHANDHKLEEFEMVGIDSLLDLGDALKSVFGGLFWA
jgi:hypothetical protein